MQDGTYFSPAAGRGLGVINTLVEKPIPFSKAAANLLSTRGIGQIHPATIHRWRARGIAGVRLDAIRIGGVWCTTEGAMQRFFAAVTDVKLKHEETGVPAVSSLSTDVQHGAIKAERQRQVSEDLDAMLGVPARTPVAHRNG